MGLPQEVREVGGLLPVSRGKWSLFDVIPQNKGKNHDVSNNPQKCFHWGIARGEASRSAFTVPSSPERASPNRNQSVLFPLHGLILSWDFQGIG